MWSLIHFTVYSALFFFLEWVSISLSKTWQTSSITSGDELILPNPGLEWWRSSVMPGRRKNGLTLRPLRSPPSPLTPMTKLLTLTPPRSNVRTSNSSDRRGRSVRLDWHDWTWHQQAVSERPMSVYVCVCEGRRRKKEKGALVIIVLRNVMCLRSCETPLALWITFRKAITTRPGSGWVRSRGKRHVSVDSTLPDLYTTLTPPPPGNHAPWLLG